MQLLVDTSVWSIALRRKTRNAEEKSIVNELEDLINNLQVIMIGPVRQELLSGIADNKQFELLKTQLTVFEDLPISTEEYERAAFFYNTCRANGIQGSHVDFLICSVAANHKLPIFTVDRDFHSYAEYLPIIIHPGRY